VARRRLYVACISHRCSLTSQLEADVVLVAIGRRPVTQGLNLEKIGVELDKRGRIVIDDQFNTSVKGVKCIGDVTFGPMLAHKAEEEGEYCLQCDAKLTLQVSLLLKSSSTATVTSTTTPSLPSFTPTPRSPGSARTRRSSSRRASSTRLASSPSLPTREQRPTRTRMVS
jgi:hypothetical protein